MITRIVKLHFQPDQAYLFPPVYARVRDLILNSPGCQSLDLHQDVDQPAIYFTISTWDHGNALEQYRQSALFKQVWPEVKSWFAHPAEAWTLQNVSA